jgi:hypothetical protein
MGNGYVKFYREMLDHPVVHKDNDYFMVWAYLLLNANHKDAKAEFKGGIITLRSGQMIRGRKMIAEKTMVQESKVERILNVFIKEKMIEQQTSNKNRLITVLKWSSYQKGEQPFEQQVNNDRTTSEQQVNTNNNDKNESIKELVGSITDDDNKKLKFGSFKNVLLTAEEYRRLIREVEGIDFMIEWFSRYIAEKGYKSKSHNLAIRRWVIRAYNEHPVEYPVEDMDPNK